MRRFHAACAALARTCLPALSSRGALAGVALAGGLALAWGAGCVSGTGPELLDPVDAGPPNPIGLDDREAGPEKRDVDVGDPFAIEGLTPSHGAWNGGVRTTVRGRGFPTKLRVWIGGAEIPSSDVFASDPTRAAIVVPAGRPGPVDVKIRDDASAQERTLPGGFVYDAFVLEPQSGATSGGTRIALKGSGTAWSAGTTVAIGGKACGQLAVVSADRIECTTAAQAAGAKDVTVTTPDGVLVQVRDAFTFSDSPDGFRGGLSGGVLSGTLRVLVLDAFTGMTLPGARAIVGGDLATAIVKQTDGAGLAEIASPTLTGKATVTVVARCHQPITFADVPVDTVTAYLNPTLDPACAEGDPPSTGNRTGRNGAEITGELVWPGGVEFKRAPWSTVPAPVRATEKQTAYVFIGAGSPADGFGLPDASLAVTPVSNGRLGYAYSLVTWPGNITIYALAGIEDRSFTPPRFTPYVMGVARGVSAQPGYRTGNVDIPMTSTLDHTVTLAPQPPPPGPRGPDRFRANLGVSLSANAFAILPWSAKERPLPVAGTVAFVGLPALVGTLASESYIVSASAGTGASAQPPASVIARLRTSDTSNPLTVSGFVPVPVLHAPNGGTWTGTSLRFETTASHDFVEATVSSAGGLVTWTIVAPGNSGNAGTTREVLLPDLSSPTLGPDNVGLRRGPIQTTLYTARIEQFDYAKLRSGQLSSAAWNAYAIDALAGAY